MRWVLVRCSIEQVDLRQRALLTGCPPLPASPPFDDLQERALLCGQVLAGVGVLQRRQRLTQLAAHSMRDFILQALEEVEAEASPADAECEPAAAPGA